MPADTPRSNKYLSIVLKGGGFILCGSSDGRNFRSKSDGKTVLAKGSVVAVTNSGVYVMTLKVKWTDPNGVSRSAEVSKPAGLTATIPLSVDSKNIEIEGSAVGGKQIFSKNFSGPGMYPFTVSGSTLINSVANGSKNDARNTFVAQECDKCIKFSNKAGYVADMTVMYFVNQISAALWFQCQKPLLPTR